MGLFDFLKSDETIDSQSKEELGVLYSTIRKLIDREDEIEIRYIAAFCGVLGRVAFADLRVSYEEMQRIRKILSKTTTLKSDQIDIIANIVETETKALVGLEDHLYAREINKLATKEQKESILLSLFLVAAADENISPEENETIRVISKSIGFTNKDFVEVRGMFKKYLSELK